MSYSSAPVDLAGGRGAVVAFRDISDRVRLGEVQASRARIATAADDARRTIERDLHDGAQQQFAAVAMRLETARRLIGTAPGDAARLVAAAHADLREAIAELRRLAHGIHPAELPGRGLASAGHVEITLARTPGALRLTVTDDGAGGAAFSGGTGLQGLRDRADAAGGRLTLASPPGGPTVLTADLPVPGPPAGQG